LKVQGSECKGKDPKNWAITLAIAVGIAVLCFAIGIPTKDDKKIDLRKLTNRVMPFNFANDKFAEFKYFVDTIQQKWRTKPEELLNLQDYTDPDNYGHSGYAIEDTDLIVEFYYFENKLYQSTINIQDYGQAKRWVEYLDSKFGEKKPDGKFYYWDIDQLRIVYASEFEIYRFHFVHMETFLAAQEYRKNVDSNLARFMKFKQVVDYKVNWKTNPETLPNISLFEKKELYKWDVYTQINVTNLEYHFFQNRLCGIDFLIWDRKQAKKMYGILKIKFGEGENEGDNGTKWDVNGITIISTPHSTARWFIFRHKETWTEKEKYAQNIYLQQNKISENKE
jgi:hypothetical protein